MDEKKHNFWDDLLIFKWANRATHQRRTRKPNTTRTNKHTKAYRCKRKARNKAALASRKMNRQRGV